MLTRRSAMTILGAVVGMAGYWWFAVVAPSLAPEPFVRVHFLRVGQGDAVLIETPNRRQVLVDAGRGIQILGALDEVMSPHDADIDIAVMTHPDADHIAGFIPVLSQYDVPVIIKPALRSGGSSLRKKVEKEIAREGARVYEIAGARSFALDGVQFEILWPLTEQIQETNAASVALLARYGETDVLLTGDSPALVEEILIKVFGDRIKDVEVLKAGHHGSKTSTAVSFLEHVGPDTVVYSFGKNNAYGHPHKEVTDRVKQYGERRGKEVREYATAEKTVSLCLTRREVLPCDQQEEAGVTAGQRD